MFNDVKMRQALWVWLDSSSDCNLNCRDCYAKKNHRGEHMSLENFRIIFDKLIVGSWHVEKLHLNWSGEPLANKEFLSFIDYRNQRWPSKGFEWHSNGLLITEDIAKLLFEKSCREDTVFISIDGGNKETHEKNRGKGTYEAGVAAINHLLSQRKIFGSDSPKIGIYQLDYGEPFRRYDFAFRRLTELVDNWVRVKPVAFDGAEMVKNYLQPQGPCFWAGNAICVATNGNVYPCLLFDGRLDCFGNLVKDSIESIMTRLNHFREHIHSHGRKHVQSCSACHKSEGTAYA